MRYGGVKIPLFPFTGTLIGILSPYYVVRMVGKTVHSQSIIAATTKTTVGRGVHRQRVIFRILELAYRNLGSDRERPVSYTHLTLPTKRIV